MKKRFLSILLSLCMVLSFLPVTAFAENSEDLAETPACTCETACTADAMNTDCPVCGAESAAVESCGKYVAQDETQDEAPAEQSVVEQVQALINALPDADTITVENCAEVEEQLEAIDEAKEKLSDEEIDELDITRYMEAAATLEQLIYGTATPSNAVMLTNGTPDEQFSLAPGGTYYFDLSGESIPGTTNTSLPDTSLHYVPFTYAGTVEAYKLASEMVSTEGYAEQNKYAHSLFVADDNVTHTVRWDVLNTEGLIFGKDYASNGVGYALRAPSEGSKNTGSGITPLSNEWDTILDKDSEYIRNWSGKLSWGQDTGSMGGNFRVHRGSGSARFWSMSGVNVQNAHVGFRPVLEVLNADTLGSDGLKAVILDLNSGKLGGSSDDIQVIVKSSSTFTAPASDGLTAPTGYNVSDFKWKDSNGNTYAPGASVPAGITKLTAQFTPATYTVTLNTNGGTINSGNVTEYTYGVGATLPTAATRWRP